MTLGMSLPFGLRDVKVFPIDASGTVGTGVDLPASQTLEFRESEDFEELRGDDVVQAEHGKGPSVTWTLEAGGISLEALVVMSGGTETLSGTTPNQIKKLAKGGTQARPYFQIQGQVISDSGGDFHAVIYKCKCDGDIGGTFADGSFWISALSGKGIPSASDKLYDLIQNETAVAIGSGL